ncbi:MAG: hypothetical protein JHC98_08930 [Thermoleophilaceae bacterium]|nr:hypothetical protein [Thermoleophilaceae bacterium]
MLRALASLSTLFALLAFSAQAGAATPRADLKLKSLTLTPASVLPGGSTTASAIVSNGGKKSAARSSTAFLLSGDTRRSTGDVNLGSVFTAKLKKTKKKSVKLDVAIPTATTPGSWFVIACADSGRKISESSEKDNCKATPLLVTVPAVPAGPAGPTAPPDSDSDGVPNSSDNCVAISNPGQSDGDGDGKGDACDFCPSDPNPGTAGCPVSVYSVKNGTTPVGTVVHLTGLVVTGLATGHIWAQLKTSDSSYAGAIGSAVAINFSDPPPMVVGDEIEVDGTINSDLHIDATSAGPVAVDSAPSPVTVTVNDFLSNPDGYDALLVKIVSSSGSSASGIWTLLDSPNLDAFKVVPEIIGTLPAVADYALNIVGVAQQGSSGWEVRPRSNADITPAA